MDNIVRIIHIRNNTYGIKFRNFIIKPKDIYSWSGLLRCMLIIKKLNS